jgi:hypothetical protein
MRIDRAEPHNLRRALCSQQGFHQTRASGQGMNCPPFTSRIWPVT